MERVKVPLNKETIDNQMLKEIIMIENVIRPSLPSGAMEETGYTVKIKKKVTKKKTSLLLRTNWEQVSSKTKTPVKTKVCLITRSEDTIPFTSAKFY